MEQYSQQKTLGMERGLFLIKYESSENPDYPPSVAIAVEPGSESAVELILPPDAEDPVLWSPGATLVARAMQACRLRVVVAASQPNGSVAARIQVVPLSTDPGGARERELAAAQLDLSEFRVLGHVAGRGDVVVDADNWVGGPLAPSRIEGIAIKWPAKPSDLTLRYVVTVGGPRPIMGQFVEAGDFAGTRGRALPLVGMTLEIDGAGAAGRQLMVKSIFLGSPQTKVVGRRVVLAGPTGREPLVGLRVRVEPTEQLQPARQVGQTPSRRQNGSGRQQEKIQPNGPAPQPAAAMVLDRDGEPDTGGNGGPSARTTDRPSPCIPERCTKQAVATCPVKRDQDLHVKAVRTARKYLRHVVSWYSTEASARNRSMADLSADSSSRNCLTSTRSF